MSDRKKPLPIVGKYKAGRYAWCTCGRSENEPFCDGSHKGTEYKPLKIELKEEKNVAWCTCRLTKTPPFCDGSHRNIQ